MRTRIQGRQANRLLPLAALGLLLIVGLSAAAAQAKVVVGVGIDGVRLGESEAQVIKTLGAPGYKMPGRSGETSWGYPKTLEGRVSFKSGQVNGMWTLSRRQKTNKGIAPGASFAQVRKAYPKAKCSTGPFGPQSLFCVMKSKYHGRAVETAFPFFTRADGLREVDINFG